MVDSSSEGGEVLTTAAIRTMVQSLLVYHPVSPYINKVSRIGTPESVLTDWRIQVLVETGQLAEQPVAEVALIAAAGPGSSGRLVAWFLAPADEFLRDDAVRILRPHVSVEAFAAHTAHIRASASFHVMNKASGGGEALRAAEARKVCATVNAGVEMLEGGE